MNTSEYVENNSRRSYDTLLRDLELGVLIPALQDLLARMRARLGSPDTPVNGEQARADIVCEYPDAYVEPYTEFFAALARFAERGQQLVIDLDLPLQNELLVVSGWCDRLQQTAQILGAMAEHQRTGAPHDPEQITSDFQRKTDQQWADELDRATPPDVEWMSDLVVR